MDLTRWVSAHVGRESIVLAMHQPLTSLQLSKRVDLGHDRCMDTIGRLSERRVVECLNEPANRHRLFWLTSVGRTIQAKARKSRDQDPLPHDFPVVPWGVYGQVCSRHRSAVVRSLTEALQPSTIRRRALHHNPALRMSANNCRGVVKALLDLDLVSRIQLPRERHPRYELTALGSQIRTLLLNAEAVPSR